MKKNDFILIFTAMAAAVLWLFLFSDQGGGAETVKISQGGKVFCVKPLSENCEVNINGTNTAVIENGDVYMKSASCPDKLCVHQGRISDSSKKIVCLPNKVIIEVIKKSEIDTVVR